MRLIKMLGLAMVAAIAAMAFIGAGTASAESSAPCKSGASLTSCSSVWPVGTAVDGSGTSELLSDLVNVKCNVTASGKITSSGLVKNGPVTGSLHLLFSSCKTEGGTACDNILDEGELLVLHGSTLSAVTFHSILGRVHCGSFIDCSYTSANVEGDWLNLAGATVDKWAVVDVLDTLENEGGFFCPNEATLHGKVEVWALEAGGVKKNIHLTT